MSHLLGASGHARPTPCVSIGHDGPEATITPAATGMTALPQQRADRCLGAHSLKGVPGEWVLFRVAE